MDELSYREALPEFFVRNHTGEIFYIKYNDIYNDNILIHYIRSAYYNKDYAFRGDIWGRV